MRIENEECLGCKVVNRVVELEKENERLKEALDTNHKVTNALNRDYVKLKQENKKLREALREIISCDIAHGGDPFDIAREILEELEQS